MSARSAKLGRLEGIGEFWMNPAACALHYGQSVFEGMKARLTESGEVVLFRPQDNARRMADGCRRLMMPVYDENDFMEAVAQTVLANKAYIPPADKGALYIKYGILSLGVEISGDDEKKHIIGPRKWYDNFVENLTCGSAGPS